MKSVEFVTIYKLQLSQLYTILGGLFCSILPKLVFYRFFTSFSESTQLIIREANTRPAALFLDQLPIQYAVNQAKCWE